MKATSVRYAGSGTALVLLFVVFSVVACKSPISSYKPNVPTGVSASTTLVGTIKVSWSGTADSYNVYRSTSASGSFSEIGSATSGSSSYSDTGLGNLETYYYYVTAVSGSAESAPSTTVTGSTTLPAPSNINFTATQGGVTLTWNAVDKATGYRVYDSSSANGTYAKIADVTSTQYTDTTATSNTRYYEITAYASSIESQKSNDIAASTLSLAAPQNLTAVGTYDGVDLTWDAVTGADSYEVYETTSYSDTKVGTTTAPTTSYSVALSTNATTDFYVVAASGLNTGSHSATVSAAREALSTPAAPTVAWTGWPDLTVSWQAVSGAETYKVYEYSSSYSTTGGTLVATVTAPTLSSTFTPASSVSFTTQYYRILAVRGTNVSSYGGATSKFLMGTPTISSVSQRGDALRVSWSSTGSSLERTVYRSDTSGGTYTLLGSVTGSPYYYDDTTAALGSTYYYEITSTDDGIETTKSASVSGTLSGVVTGVTATNGTELNASTVSWDNMGSLADTYHVYGASTETGTYTELGTATSTSYQDTTLAKGQTRWYKVVAYKGGTMVDTLTAASAVSGTAFGAAPPAPTATSGTGTIEVSWGAVPGAARYAVDVYNDSGVAIGGMTVGGNQYFTARDVQFTPPATYTFYSFKVYAIFSGSGTPTSAQISNASTASGLAEAY